MEGIAMDGRFSAQIAIYREGDCRWVEDPPEARKAGWYLEPRDRFAVERMYDPIEDEPALFYALASSKPTRDGILDFVNQYGLLLGTFPDGALWQNSLTGWREEIKQMEAAIMLWLSLQQGDKRTLAQHVCWDEEGVRFTSPLFRGRHLLVQGIGPTGPSRITAIVAYEEGDLIGPAKELLWSAITKRLDGLSGKARFLFLRDEGAASIYVDELSHVLWLQLAYAIANRGNVRLCEHCGDLFTVETETRKGRKPRNDKRFCSGACRYKATYRRKATARKMRAEGKHLREIAKAVETEVKTVKGWLGE